MVLLRLIGIQWKTPFLMVLENFIFTFEKKLISKKVNLRIPTREINGLADDVITQMIVSETLSSSFENVILNCSGKYSFHDPKILRLKNS